LDISLFTFHFLTSPIIAIENCWLAGLRNRLYH
jgi:hypothetical protein